MSEDLFVKNAEALCKALGVKVADLKKSDANVAELAESVTAGIVENNKADIEIDAKKTATAAAYKKLEKQLLSAFDLDAKKYEALTKGQLDAMLEDAKQKLQEKPAEKAGDKANDNAELEKLRTQLAESEKMRTAAVEEAKKLKALEADLPVLLEKRAKEVSTNYEYQSHVQKAIASLRAKGLRADITDKMIKAEIFGEDVDLEPQEADGKISFRVAKVQKNADGTKSYKAIQKSASEAYSSLEDYALEKVVKEEWLSKNAQPPANGGNTPASGGKDLSAMLPPELR